ncbi:hypothetical protein ACMA1D_18350 [Streptomyces sp. 796.1]
MLLVGFDQSEGVTRMAVNGNARKARTREEHRAAQRKRTLLVE